MNLTFPCRFKCTMPFMKPNSPWLLIIQTACLKNWANLKVSDNFQEKGAWSSRTTSSTLMIQQPLASQGYRSVLTGTLPSPECRAFFPISSSSSLLPHPTYVLWRPYLAHSFFPLILFALMVWQKLEAFSLVWF